MPLLNEPTQIETGHVNPFASAPISFINDGGTVTVNGNMLSEAAASTSAFRSVTIEGNGVNITGDLNVGRVTARANAGNIVFNGATIWWANGLSSPPGHVNPSRHGVIQQGPDERVQQITHNLFQRIIASGD